ncbi:MAG: NAD(P)H-hydrate dehydratase [Myxococcales bacterium]|nr:MAG: NAD(P)H-hydrate dehydratase [Myxococcales bacterium]
MRPVLTREQMRAYDKHAIEVCHVPGLVLMENAGRGAADVIGRLRPLEGLRVAVVCGAGNNGGDGFVVARHLLARGAVPHVWLTGRSEQVTGDARIHHDAYIDLGGDFTALDDHDDVTPIVRGLEGVSVIVDALFGTGLGRPLEGLSASVAGAINASSALRVSLDLPSGLDADTGAPRGSAVQAHHTVTFGHLKVGLLTPEGARLAGQVHVVDLGVPDRIVEHTGHVGEVVEASDVRRWLRPREANAHKHQAGAVAIVAGSRGKVGAALLGARTALRAGAGLATLVTWADVLDAVQGRVVEVMTAAIEPDRLTASLDEALKRHKVAVVGPGLGLDDRARLAVEHVALRWDGIKVLDADALTHFAGRPEALAGAPGTLVLTPHSAELGRLLGLGADDVERDRFGAVREVAKRTGAIVLLKGARTLVASDEPMLINATGNPSLATAGAGDVLAGLIAALACHMTPRHAAAAGAFLHGLAADRWRARSGSDRGLLASELSDELPALFGELLAPG